MEVITVSELARKMNLKASDLIGKLMSMGMMVTINQQIDAETAEILAGEYGCKVKIVSLYDETIIETEKDREEDLRSRPPIVTIMGHVDHGKTKLLDAIRTADVVASRVRRHHAAHRCLYGGTAQRQGQRLPSSTLRVMRRSPSCAPAVPRSPISSSSWSPQTTGSCLRRSKRSTMRRTQGTHHRRHQQDRCGEANPDRVKQQLSQYELIPEEWGGSTIVNEISALKKLGIQELLESILLQAEILELKANYDTRAEGKVVESKIDHGRGIVATVLIERGTLRIGESFIAGIYPGKVRAMFDDKGEKVDEATPSMPVEILGFTGIPNAGDPFQVTETEKAARQVGSKRQELRKVEDAKNVKKITLDNLYDSIQQGEVQELKVDHQRRRPRLGRSPADRAGEAHHQGNPADGYPRVGRSHQRKRHHARFRVERDRHRIPCAADTPGGERSRIRKRWRSGSTTSSTTWWKISGPRWKACSLRSSGKRPSASVEVRDTFKVPKIGIIAGCYVLAGKIRRNASVHVRRGTGWKIYTGKISSLKRFKDDAREVDTGYECGIGMDNFNDIKVGDQFEVFEMKEFAKKLQGSSAG